jgi:hypothetical protein
MTSRKTTSSARLAISEATRSARPATSTRTKQKPLATDTSQHHFAEIRHLLTATCPPPSGTFYRLSARAAFVELEGDIVLMRGSGAVSVECLMDLDLCLNDRHGDHAAGWLYDLRAAVLMAGDDDLYRLSRMPHPDVQQRPGAFVVHPTAAESIREQCLRFALLGFPRRYFFDGASALEWLHQVTI